MTRLLTFEEEEEEEDEEEDFAAMEDRQNRMDKPPTQYRYNGGFFQVNGREQYVRIRGQPMILTRCTKDAMTYQKYDGATQFFKEDDPVCREFGGTFSIPEAHLSEPVTETPGCISGKEAAIPAASCSLLCCIRFPLTRGTRMAFEFSFRSAIYAFLLSEFPAPPPFRRTSTRAHKA